MSLSKKELCKRLKIIDKYIIDNNVDLTKSKMTYEQIAFFMSVIPKMEKFYFDIINLNHKKRISAVQNFVLEWLISSSDKCLKGSQTSNISASSSISDISKKRSGKNLKKFLSSMF